MPETTLTGWKHRIADYAETHDITLGASKIQRLAIRINKRFISYNDCDLAKVIQHSDPTGETAVRNVMASVNSPDLTETLPETLGRAA